VCVVSIHGVSPINVAPREWTLAIGYM